MNRIIKYQFWIETEKRMIDSVGFAFESNSSQIRIWYMKGESTLNESFATHNVTERQFTGLHDKNGKGLYFGDVFKQTMLNGSEKYYKVFEKNGGATINIHQDDFRKEVGNILFYEPLHTMQGASWFTANCEIIGNIYENPELLNP